MYEGTWYNFGGTVSRANMERIFSIALVHDVSTVNICYLKGELMFEKVDYRIQDLEDFFFQEQIPFQIALQSVDNKFSVFCYGPDGTETAYRVNEEFDPFITWAEVKPMLWDLACDSGSMGQSPSGEAALLDKINFFTKRLQDVLQIKKLPRLVIK